ncbi:MAG TPA: hypothetical protein VFE45_09150 [Coriobacteriia bacterium]|nr:hypothetical protein [Coriobacteriia bacterium]
MSSGFPAQYKEAIKFATLAVATLRSIGNNIPAASGARSFGVLRQARAGTAKRPPRGAVVEQSLGVGTGLRKHPREVRQASTDHVERPVPLPGEVLGSDECAHRDLVEALNLVDEDAERAAVLGQSQRNVLDQLK